MARRTLLPTDCPNKPLTLSQQRFVAEYPIDLNATAAAERAGFSDPDYGRALLRKAHVQDAIMRAAAKRMRRTDLSADRVLQEIARIAFSKASDLFTPDGHLRPPSEWCADPDLDATIASMDVVSEETTVATTTAGVTTTTTTVRTTVRKVKRWDKTVALDRAMRHLMLMTDVRLVSGRIEIDSTQAREGMQRVMTDPDTRAKMQAIIDRLADAHTRPALTLDTHTEPLTPPTADTPQPATAHADNTPNTQGHAQTDPQAAVNGREPCAESGESR